MNADTLLAFSALALITVATPGPTVLLAMSNGSRYGARAAVPSVLGAVASDFVLMGAVTLGLGALLTSSTALFAAVKWLGVGYLAYFGLRLLRSKGLPTSARVSTAAVIGPLRLFEGCFLVAVTNPKAYLFFTALLPQFIDPAQQLVPQYTAFALTFASIDGIVVLGYSFAGTRVLCLLHRSGFLWMERLCGASLLAMAGSLALYAAPQRNN
jgi:homoserine/homoserine lactone efflux protein